MCDQTDTNQAEVHTITVCGLVTIVTHQPYMLGDEYWNDHAHYNTNYAVGWTAPRHPVPALIKETAK